METPRTDAIFFLDPSEQENKFINLCHQLEIELAESKANADGILRQFKELHSELNNWKEIAEELAEVANLAPNSYQSEYGIECRLKEVLAKYNKFKNEPNT